MPMVRFIWNLTENKYDREKIKICLRKGIKILQINFDSFIFGN